MGISPSEVERRCSDEEDDRHHQRNFSESKRTGRKRGSKILTRSDFIDEKLDDNLSFNDIVDSFDCTQDRLVREFDEDMERMFSGTDIVDSFDRTRDRLAREFDEDMERMFSGTDKLKNDDGTFCSTRMFSSVTTIGDDGVAVSKSKGVSKNSSGRYKEVNQERIGDRSETLLRERKNKNDEFKEYQTLHQISHDDLPDFRKEFKDRTKEWGTYRDRKGIEKTRQRLHGREPRLALEDGRQSRALRLSHQTPVSNLKYPGSELYI